MKKTKKGNHLGVQLFILAGMMVLWVVFTGCTAESNKQMMKDTKYRQVEVTGRQAKDKQLERIHKPDENEKGNQNIHGRVEEGIDTLGEGEVDQPEHSETGYGQEENHIQLSDNVIKMVGLKTDRVKMAELKKEIQFNGEIGFDEDRFCKVVPRFPGIVKKVNKKLGDHVKAGDILAIVESNESLTAYGIKSLISGTVVRKNITMGEFVSDSTTIYEIADLARVWANLSVHARNSKDIQIGQKAMIESVETKIRHEGVISYISPFFNRDTRNLTARIVLPNHEGLWSPGTFVKGSITLMKSEKVPVIRINAVQMIEEQPTVFVPGNKNEFIPVFVTLGESDREHVEIINGLKPGDRYVSSGAFELKAKLITSSLGSHAGHIH